jgi:hypothetical protein
MYRSHPFAQDMTRLAEREPALYQKLIKLLTLAAFIEIRALQTDYRTHRPQAHAGAPSAPGQRRGWACDAGVREKEQMALNVVMRRSNLFGDKVAAAGSSRASRMDSMNSLAVVAKQANEQKESIVQKMDEVAAAKPIVVKFAATGEWHGYSLESALKLRIVAEDQSTRPVRGTAELAVGMKVEHDVRGQGVVVNTVGNKKPVIIKFVNGEVHSYTQKSATKMRVLMADGSEQKITGLADIMVGLRVKHAVRGKGVVASVTGNLHAAVRLRRCSPGRTRRLNARAHLALAWGTRARSLDAGEARRRRGCRGGGRQAESTLPPFAPCLHSSAPIEGPHLGPLSPRRRLVCGAGRPIRSSLLFRRKLPRPCTSSHASRRRVARARTSASSWHELAHAAVPPSPRDCGAPPHDAWRTCAVDGWVVAGLLNYRACGLHM